MEETLGNFSAGAGNFSRAGASDDEAGFVEALARREEWAFREFLNVYSDKLYRLAFRFLRQGEEAQDVLQEVVKKVLEKIESFRGEAKFSTWIYRVTVNEALMRLRSKRQAATVSWEEILPKYEDGVYIDPNRDWSKLPEARLQESEAREYLKQCIQQLPEDYRAAYLLKDVEELSENEVCSILGLDKSVMKVRVHRARMFLRKKLEERYVD
ncbi:MAG TPA: sigma-70 family RNA polymerase sigma factor [bacterium]|nr:sigma-70 family RNA polymerase sigma factor [bacterium]